MSTTVGEAIQRVQSLYSKGIQSKDTRLSPRHIYSSLLTSRATILKQQANKNQMANKWIWQTLPCVELIKASAHECPCAPPGCIILRTRYKLPTPIAGLSQMLISSVTDLTGNLTFDVTDWETTKYGVGNKYTATKPAYYIRNQYGWIVNRTQIKAVTMGGLFDDPIEARLFPSYCGDCPECQCGDIMETEFPVDKDTLRAVLQLASNELIIMFGQMKEDKETNSSDDITLGNQMIHQPQEQQQ